MTYPAEMAGTSETERVLGACAAAWAESDLEAVLAADHDDFVLHHSGESPLTGTHVGDAFEALLALEDLGDPPRRVRRILLSRVTDGTLRDGWLFDEDQRFVDGLWSTQP